MTDANYKVLTSDVFYTGYVQLSNDTIVMPNGQVVTHFVMDAPGSVGVVGLTDNNEIVLVEQYRYAVKRTFLEIPGGRIEKGESPEECARREFLEETGYIAQKWTKLIDFYPANSFSNQLITLFLAENLSLSQSSTNTKASPNVHLVPCEMVFSWIKSAKIQHGSTIIGVLIKMLAVS